MKNSICPVCETGNLVEHNELDSINYKNQSLIVEIEYSVCTACGEEMIVPDQIKRNDCRIQDVWKKSAEDICDKIKELARSCYVTVGDYSYCESVFDTQKFAELIIKECIENIEQFDHHINPTREVVPTMVSQIKEHFGVK
jgi:YgiT-type zinc finger domain-containing protein